MNNFTFDYDINNYRIDELKEMFELPENYDKNIVEIKENQLRENIFNNREINDDTRKLTLNFLLKAKNILINQQSSQSQHLTKFQEKIENFYNSSYELKTSKIDSSNEHMVQEREHKPYLSSYPSEFFPGIINPLKKRTIKKFLNIDTRFRDNYYNSSSSNFSLALPIELNDVLSMQLNAFEIPLSYYNISKQFGNNYFNITVEDTTNNFSTGVVFIPDGNYDYQGIVAIINTQLINLGGDFANISFLININNNINGSGQMMVGLVPNATTPISFSLNFQADKNGLEDRGTPLPLKLGWMLGFRNGIYTDNLNYVSEGVVDITGSRYMYLAVDDYNNNVNNGFYSAFNSSLLNKNILARISIQSKLFNNFSQNNLAIVTNPREYFGPVNIQNLNIQLLDEYGRNMDLNNMDYSFCLTLITAYDI